MPENTLLDSLQDQFQCNRCGVCCAVGGNMLLTYEDICRIADFLCCEPEDWELIPVKPDALHPGKYRLMQDIPCFYLDKVTMECSIQDAKPEACTQYPFKLLKEGGCRLSDVLVCPKARKTIADYFGFSVEMI